MANFNFSIQYEYQIFFRIELMQTPENLSFPNERDYIQQISIDCVIFGYKDEQLKVLIPKIHFEGDFWCVPSGFVYQHESTDQAARRIIEERTGINTFYLEQFSVFGNTTRNNKDFLDNLVKLNPDRFENIESIKAKKAYEWFVQRFVSIGYYALVDINKVVPQKADIDESIEWYDIKNLPTMIMDHNTIVQKAWEMLRLFIDQKLSAYNLLPETFTMKEIQQLYEAIFDRPFAANNFPKKILEQNVLERLEKQFTGAANKAPYLYRLKK
ncbi:MAG: NUDIX hydrolase [Flavobacterium sp.]